MSNAFLIFSLVGAGFFGAALFALQLFSRQRDSFEEWMSDLARVADENIRESQVARMRALSAASDFASDEQARAA